MDKILVRGLKIFAYHGVNEEEKIDGQNFILDENVIGDIVYSAGVQAGDELVAINGNPITDPALADGLYRVYGADGTFLCLSEAKDGVLTAREIGALENCRASRLQLGDVTVAALNSHIDALKNLRERNEFDKKIESDPLSALNEYLGKMKKKKNDTSNTQEDNNG